MASEENLVERLQAYIDACSGPGITLYEGHPAVLMREALDDISRLAAERGALMAERTSLIATKRSQLDALTARATAAEARVAQLETALSQLLRAEYDGPGLRDCTDNDGVAYQSADLANHIAAAEQLGGAALQVEERKG